MLISIVVAMTPERLIGAAGRLPWHLPEDLKRFRKLTLGHAMVMGRKTFSSLGRPLPGRRNLVVSRNANPPAVAGGGVEWFTSLDDAVAAARAGGETECFIAGGTEIYAAALKCADRMYITFVQGDSPYQGDTYFPAWDPAQWQTAQAERVGALEFVVYERVKGAEQGAMAGEAGN